MTMTATFAPRTRPLALIARLFSRPAAPQTGSGADPDQSRARRDFILDRMNDGAFASEYDVQEMMALHPREF
ncbi:MAG: hypothetical protein KDK10_03280 [Maritimibacter sp.]|nr:hypothetical protein [Maritimibacter sp.]